VRHGLLGLHKALIVAEQLTYERIYGRVDSTGQLLQLVMNDLGLPGCIRFPTWLSVSTNSSMGTIN